MSQKGTKVYVPPDVEGMKELLGVMTSTLGTLGQTLDTLKDQSDRVAVLGPQMDSAHQIHQLRRAMRAQEKKQDLRVEDLTHLIKDVLKEEIAQMLEAEINELIADEIKLQIEEQVKAQLTDMGLDKIEAQAKQGEKQVKDVRVALINSDSRTTNSKLRANNLDDCLAVLLKPDGEESELFPQELRTLFGYNNETAKALVRDYGLVESDQREENLNAFMAHAGIQFHLVPVPATPNSQSTFQMSGIAV
ncbi:hypothetical protein FRB96_000589 [Tulasnella sp. 330]|nr:hypothetical protein FRB96_000589 [Tulasnella sp. 330]KAG8882063.1 hypothetical protein FRB97_008733 [Tulasnella sp. 331]KAG8888090.1 hypothetical protein FRB98_008427 [Tulasnella sp. 332]